MVKAVINIDAPREQVFSALTGFAHYSEWVPSCERCDIVSATGGVTDVHVVLNSLKRMELGLRFEAAPSQLLKFWLTKSANFKRYAGTYRLMDAADRKGTVVLAELDVDAGMLAPRMLVEGVTSRALRDTGEALKKFVRTLSGNGYSAARTITKETATSRLVKPLVRIIQTPNGYQSWMFGQYSSYEAKGK